MRYFRLDGRKFLILNNLKLDIKELKLSEKRTSFQFAMTKLKPRDVSS